MHITVVGCGSIGRRHIANLLALGCRVDAYDVSDEALAQVPSGAARHRYRPSDGITMSDALVIATPWDRHLHLVWMAIEHGWPFFVEKPLGSLEQLPRWRDVAAMDLPVNQVGYMLRFHQLALEMKAAVVAPTRGYFRCESDSQTWPGSSYGPMLLEFSHEIDLALSYGASPIVTEARFRDSDGYIKLGSWQIAMDAKPSSYVREWTISNGVVGHQCRFDGPNRLGNEMYVAEMAHFLACVREQKPTACPLADGLRVLEVCQQVETLCQSSASSKPA